MAVPRKWEIAQFWEQNRNRDEFAPWLSLDEPCCFACGWFSERWVEKSPRARWGRTRLERAHIVPRSLGGPDTADNLLLLCRPCHEDSPDWPDPRQMARWIATRAERPSKELETFQAWCAAASEVPELVDAVASVATEQHAQERVTDLLQGLMTQAGTHFAVGISPGTRVAVLRTAAERISSWAEHGMPDG
ncbi:HNH endonuclease [Streptomyces noursei]|uniref:HNH endonuclease n=1 Tax=Streptomyces noursei TaxID=1971 RepID=UPI003644E7AE